MMDGMNDTSHMPPVIYTGTPPDEATSAMILLHGRGASADNILELADLLPHPGMVYIAPQAPGNSWYPFSFLSPLEQNEPALTRALGVVAALLDDVVTRGVPPERVILAGFSQGACLACEFVVRHPRRYGGLLVFSGGLIGPPGMERHDTGDLARTPAFIGCGDQDSHIPVVRVQESAEILRHLNADLTAEIYPGMGHTINQAEIDHARALVARLAQPQA
jgi:predicted esterase